MKLSIHKGYLGIKGLTPYDQSKLDELKKGDYRCEIKRIRNPKFHRKFFSMVGVGFDMQEEFKTMDAFLDRLKILSGHYEEKQMELLDGTMVWVKSPKSISFAKMEQVDFEEFHSRVVDTLIEHFCPGATPLEIDEAARMYIDYT